MTKDYAELLCEMNMTSERVGGIFDSLTTFIDVQYLFFVAKNNMVY